ncbi:cell division protein DivIVA [Geodermatophilus sp. Leaf369]|uniref:DivIVA domain-containing protein n=1 Tax=Geodermatophilus sp. Leaf369 TaxID=1736354 RepID=UPI0006FF03F5|nr:DivIVA domain-containing protein [Geodermatophilus sp. Leaf369]KQS60212.1 cell division protein DivIVA [Geodermatophilus sp. Leaf369]
MVSVVVFVVGLLLVGGLLFLGSAVLLGRGETQPPAELDRSPVELPDDRPVVGDDVRALQVSVAVRGYRMTEVDWLLDQLAQTIDERDVEIARLRAGGGAHAAVEDDNPEAGDVEPVSPAPADVEETPRA